jgi:hypothetical protein
LQKDAIAVGDSAELEIIFDTRQYNRKMSKRPKIITNIGPPDKHVAISCTPVVRPDSTYPITFNPYKLDLTQFGEKVRENVTFDITNVSDQKVQFEVIATRDNLWEIELPKSIDPGKTKKAVLKLTRQGLEQSFEKSFTIQVNDENKSRFTVPVKRSIHTARQHRVVTPATTTNPTSATGTEGKAGTGSTQKDKGKGGK